MNETAENTADLINESPKVKKITEDLSVWLSKTDWNHNELRRWVKGYSLPAMGNEEEPFTWILLAFPDSNDFRCIMGERIANFINTEKPYQIPSAKDDDKFFYNLFYLCAGLNCKNKLGEPLYEIFKFFENNRNRREQFFSKEQSYNLNNAFREALIFNQIDMRFKEIWKSGLESKQESYLSGDMYSYFRGVLHLNDDGQPAIDEIGQALKRMADYLQEEKYNSSKFRNLIVYVQEVWGDAFNWNELLIHQAIKYNWQDWAIVKLDKLIVPLNKFTDNKRHYFIWEIYLPFLGELKIDFDVIFKTDVLLEIKASQKEIKLFIEKTAPTIELIRLNAPYKSYKSILGAANEGFMELERYLTYKGELKLAGAIERGRIQILEKLGFGKFDQTERISNEKLFNYPQNIIPLLSGFNPMPYEYFKNAIHPNSGLYWNQPSQI